MKRKLIIALGLVACIFILSGAFILRSLSGVRLVTHLKDRQEDIVANYDRMLYLLGDDQTVLYAFEAGYGRDLVRLDSNMQQTRTLLTNLKAGYAMYSSHTCEPCHSRGINAGGDGTAERLLHHEKTLREIQERVALYEEKVGRIIRSGNAGGVRLLVNAAAKDSDAIVPVVQKLRNLMYEMDISMEAMEVAAESRLRNSILFAFVAGILLFAVIAIMTVRSITGPLNRLIRGMEKVSAGDFGSKVELTANDEIGFLAGAFNKMTDSLDEAMMQKEALLKELKELTSDLDRRVREATEKVRVAHERLLRNETLSAVGTFAAGVAHELASPISSIMNYFQMLKGRIPEKDGVGEDLQIIERELHRCYGILRGMLNLAKAPEIEKSSADINAMLRDLLALVRYQPAYKKTITIVEALASGIPPVPAVAGELRQVFMNVLVNALQSMPEGGTLSVSTSLTEDGEKVVVGISDTGHGIPESEMDMVFQPFYTNRESGMGLGLSISHGIIRGHGGDIKVKSEHGKGTTFLIFLPVKESAPLSGSVSPIPSSLATEG